MTMSTDTFQRSGDMVFDKSSLTSTSTQLMCVTCGTQYNPVYSPPGKPPIARCRICDDPRQFVPPSGQHWTSLAQEQGKHRNVFEQDPADPRVFFISTEPKLGIGNRCILLRTEAGNVLWDLIPYLDSTTISIIKCLGGLKAIVISHPHYYSTHLTWAKAFDCSVYVAADDQQWLNRTDSEGARHLIHDAAQDIVPGVRALKAGGHFDGSLLLHWENKLFTADTIMMVPSAHTTDPLPDTAAFVFMWSYPNTIPLWPAAIHGIWRTVKPLSFNTVHGAFAGQDLRASADLKPRVLESMKIFVRKAGHEQHALLEETI